jgi:uncharacterized protein YcfL
MERFLFFSMVLASLLLVGCTLNSMGRYSNSISVVVHQVVR